MGGGPPEFRPGSTCPTLLGDTARRALPSPTGLSPSVGPLSNGLRLGRAFVTPLQAPARLRASPATPSAQRAGLDARSVWAHPFSLAATGGVEVSFLSRGYLDVSVPRVRLRTLFIQMRILAHYREWVAPFGDLRIKASGSSPELIAANHVLHRLWAPRHPPYTLSSLTTTPP